MTVDATHPDKTASDSAERRYATVNPYTGQTEAEFDFLTPPQVDEAVSRAHAAFAQWRRRSVEERASIVRHAAELMLARQDELAGLVTREMGKLIRESGYEVKLAAGIVQWYGERGPELLAPEPLEVSRGEAALVNEPLGVLLGIEPWNFPLYQVARFAAPYLVAGNTILLKHAEICPQTALALEQLFLDAGVPAGVYQNVFLRIADVERVIAHPAVQGVSLTGSERAGASVAAIAGKHLKRCVLELGGSDPFVVLDAPDLDQTLNVAVAGRMSNTGQSCIAAKRFILPGDLFQPFVAGLAERFAQLQPGDPADPATTLGPLSSERAAADLMAQVQDAIDRGAAVAAGGARPDHPGAFVQPTVLTGVRPGMRAYEEELFGPVAVVYRVNDDDEAVELANATRYGLGGTVFGSDLERAQGVAERIESGMVWINQPTSSQAELPFGGIKASGFGRELGRPGILEFVNRKLIRTMPPRRGGTRPPA